MKLSALICAQNDEARLGECLRRVAFCDDIVVVADRCTDRTAEIARQHGATVVDGIFPHEGQRKSVGVAACRGAWILEVDPSELVDPALAYEIRAAIHGRPDGDWFTVPVQHVVNGRLVRRGWSREDECAPKLYRRHVKRWAAGRVTPSVAMNGRFAGAIETPLRRQSYADLGQMLSQLGSRTNLRAQDLADAGTAGKLGGDILRAAGRFLDGYVLRQGLREGELGFLVSLVAGLEIVLSGVRARELIRVRAAAEAEPLAQPAQLGLAGRR